jgi:hypothetical protein
MAEKERFEVSFFPLFIRGLRRCDRMLTTILIFGERFVEHFGGGGELFFSELSVDVHSC